MPHLIFVDVRVNGSAPFQFILDTASTWTFLDAERARLLGLDTEAGLTTMGAGETPLQIRFARDVVVDVSGVELKAPKLAVASLGGKPYAGLIGSDLFRRFVVEIDYDAESIRLHEPAMFKYAGPGKALPLTFRDEIPSVRVQVATKARGPLNARLDVDTGAAQPLILTRPFVESNKLLPATKGMLEIESAGLGGRSTYLIGRTTSVALGPFVFNDWLTGFSRDQRGAGAATDRDGIVGNGLLKRFKVILDYSRKRLILEPGTLESISFDYDWCGFDVVADGSEFRIRRVLRNTLASDAGLREGDVVIAVDGQRVAGLTLEHFRRIFNQDGRARLLTVRRDDATLPLKLETLRIP